MHLSRIRDKAVGERIDRNRQARENRGEIRRIKDAEVAACTRSVGTPWFSFVPSHLVARVKLHASGTRTSSPRDKTVTASISEAPTVGLAALQAINLRHSGIHARQPRYHSYEGLILLCDCGTSNTGEVGGSADSQIEPNRTSQGGETRAGALACLAARRRPVPESTGTLERHRRLTSAPAGQHRVR